MMKTKYQVRIQRYQIINTSIPNWFFENTKARQKDKTVANTSKGKTEENIIKSPNWEIIDTGEVSNLLRPYRSGHKPLMPS